MNKQPNKWIAALLGLTGQYFGLLYVGKGKWAIFYFLLNAIIAVIGFIYPSINIVEKFNPYFLIYLLGGINISLMFICSMHAYRIAANNGGMQGLVRPWYSRRQGLLAIFAIPMAMIILFRAFLFEPFNMSAESMLPSITKNSKVIVKKWGYGNYGTFGVTLAKRPMTSPINRGDIIIFEYPKDRSISYAKRVVGLPGDHVEFIDRQLKVNQEIIQTKDISIDMGVDSYHNQKYEPKGESFPENTYPVVYSQNIKSTDFIGTVPADNYFLMGDNRDNSNDSRYWGYVPKQNIVGKVTYIFNWR